MWKIGYEYVKWNKRLFIYFLLWGFLGCKFLIYFFKVLYVLKYCGICIMEIYCNMDIVCIYVINNMIPTSLMSL